MFLFQWHDEIGKFYFWWCFDRLKIMQNYGKPLRIRFDKIDEFVRVYGGTRYLVLYEGEKYDFIYNRIIYLLGVKRGVAFPISHIMQKPNLKLSRKILTFHSVIIHIKSVLNKG